MNVHPRIDYSLSNAGPEMPLIERVRVRFERHRIEEVFEASKCEAGLAHYEVRSWVGWHHHITLSLLGAVVLDPGASTGGGETPAVTVSQVREIVMRLLRVPAPAPSGLHRR